MINMVLNENAIYDILEATVDINKLKETNGSMEFKDGSIIVLYTSLNENNYKKLQNNQYKNLIFAFEYPEMADGNNQSEYIIKIGYDTKGLCDTLYPKAYAKIEEIIKQHNIKKSEIEDIDIIKLLLLQQYTGVRVHCLSGNKKCYTKTKIIYQDSKLCYILKPDCITILDAKKK